MLTLMYSRTIGRRNQVSCLSRNSHMCYTVAAVPHRPAGGLLDRRITMKTVIASTVVRVNLTTGAEGQKNIEVTHFHTRLYDAAFKAAHAVCNAVTSQRVVMATMLRAQYGNVAPTYAQFRADRSALACLALKN